MKTALEAIEFIDTHSKNLLLTRDGHGALLQILSAAKQQAQAAVDAAAAETGKNFDHG